MKIRKVEEMIKKHHKSAIKIPEINRQFIDKISQKSLKLILKNLEEENKIFIGSKGVTWIKNSKLK